MNRLTFISTLAGGLVAAVPFRAAQEPYTRVGPIKAGWVTVQPELGPNRSFVKWVVKAEFFVAVIEPSGEAKVTSVGTIEKDLLADTAGVFIGTTPYSDRLVARLMDDILMREYRKHHPTDPEDDERARVERAKALAP